MKKERLIPLLLIVASAALAIVSYFVLPQEVVIQISLGSSGHSTAPKLLAVLIPLALGAGGAVSVLMTKEDEKAKGKGLLVSLVGIAVFVIMLAVNCF